MKQQLIFIAIFLFRISYSVLAQDYSSLKDIELKEKSDFAKAEDKVLECSKYLLSTPMDDSGKNRVYCTQFILEWMVGTPDYNFTIDEIITKIAEPNKLLLGVCLASMAKYVLENKDNAKDTKEIKYNSILMLINYAQESKNNVVIKGELKKLIKEKEKGKLKEYLKLD